MPDLLDRARAAGHSAQTFVGQSWPAYRCLRAVLRSPRNDNLVSQASDLCIEGPAGSGNSFFVNGFIAINPKVLVAHHHHVAGQVKRAVALGLPTIALLRAPVDCVTSRSALNPTLIGAMYRQWLRFFRAVEPIRDQVLLAPFETATQRPAEIVRLLNRRWRTSFRDDFPDADAIFDRMNRSYSSFAKEATHNPNMPDQGKELLKERIRPRVLAHPLAAISAKLYEDLRGTRRTGAQLSRHKGTR